MPSVLIIDSESGHSRKLKSILSGAGYSVAAAPHDLSLRLVRDAARYDAIIVRTTPERPTPTMHSRVGEFVLRYIEHVTPAVLSRTIIVTTSPALIRFPRANAILEDPFDPQALLAALEACVQDRRHVVC